MWTTDIDRAATDDYYASDEPPDYLFVTPEQAEGLDWFESAFGVRVRSMPWRGKHSRPSLVPDLDQKGRITP
ncbi:MAG: hypothetical protein M3Q75_12735 [Gemmatimonadota bacterium]|nr:hypothetical protein [Gemmatimonadota bacterium]